MTGRLRTDTDAGLGQKLWAPTVKHHQVRTTCPYWGPEWWRRFEEQIDRYTRRSESSVEFRAALPEGSALAETIDLGGRPLHPEICAVAPPGTNN
jgi:hypothetical protein